MILANDRLHVEIADLGTVYQGARFDWTGFITQVTLDQAHTFCVPESIIEGDGTGGIGCCNEFGIFQPIGYGDALPGEPFPKLGVGLLTKPDNAPYEFFLPYKIEPFPVEIKSGTDWISYDVAPLPCRGYEARLRKTIQLRSASFDIVYELENVGTHPIRTHEYNHNFVAVNGRPPGPGYLLRLAKELTFSKIPSPLSLEGRDLLWRESVPSPFPCAAQGSYSKIDGPVWELQHEPDGVGMSEALNAPIELFSIWCTPRLIGPEVFVSIDLKPRENMTWTRHYEFFAIL